MNVKKKAASLLSEYFIFIIFANYSGLLPGVGLTKYLKAPTSSLSVTEMGLETAAAIEAVGNFQCGFGRMEGFDLGAKGTRMMLVKNPASCNQVLEFLDGIREPFVLGVFLNDHFADGTDVSWVWDANYELLEDMGDRVSRVIVSGSRAWDMYLRIKYAGIPEDRIIVEQDYDALVRMAQAETLPVFLMPTYTAMMDLRQVVVKYCGGAEFWE